MTNLLDNNTARFATGTGTWTFWNGTSFVSSDSHYTRVTSPTPHAGTHALQVQAWSTSLPPQGRTGLYTIPPGSLLRWSGWARQHPSNTGGRMEIHLTGAGNGSVLYTDYADMTTSWRQLYGVGPVYSGGNYQMTFSIRTPAVGPPPAGNIYYLSDFLFEVVSPAPRNLEAYLATEDMGNANWAQLVWGIEGTQTGSYRDDYAINGWSMWSYIGGSGVYTQLEQSSTGTGGWSMFANLAGSTSSMPRAATQLMPKGETRHFRARYSFGGSYSGYSNTVSVTNPEKGRVTFRHHAHWPVVKSTVLSSKDGGESWDQIDMTVFPTASDVEWIDVPFMALGAVADDEGWLIGGSRQVAVALGNGNFTSQTRGWVGRLKDGEWTLSYPFGEAIGAVNAMAYSPTLNRWVINGAYSSDGVNWTTGGAGGFSAIRWGGGKFIAVAAGVWTSSDGINWQARSLPGYASGPLSDARWNGSTWVAGGYQNGFWTSPDGITWTKREYPSGYFGAAVHHFAYSPELDRWVTTSHGGRNTLYSDDNGATWVESPNESSWDEYIVWSSLSRRFIGLLANRRGQTTSSPDGINWTARGALPWTDTDLAGFVPSTEGFGLVESGGEILVVGYGGVFRPRNIEGRRISSR